MKVATFIESGKMTVTEAPVPEIQKTQMPLLRLFARVSVVPTFGGLEVFLNANQILIPDMKLSILLKQ